MKIALILLKYRFHPLYFLLLPKNEMIVMNTLQPRLALLHITYIRYIQGLS